VASVRSAAGGRVGLALIVTAVFAAAALAAWYFLD
jgi:hypothetical protein